MDVNNIASLAASLSASKTNEEVGVAVLKKALDIQKTNAATLLQALPPLPTPNLPPHLGQNIDTIA